MWESLGKLKYIDAPLAAASGLLLLVGLVMLYATSLSNQSLSIFWRQLTFGGIGVILYFFFALYNYQHLARANRVIYVLTVAVLLFVLFFGVQVKGSSRWIDIGFFRFQPAEFMKLVAVLGLARLFYLRRGEINSWLNIFISVVYVTIPAVLIIFEPDLGSALTLFAIWGGMLMVSRIHKRYIVLLFIFGLLLTGIAWKYVLHEYQRHRIEVFLNPDLDPQGKGYNVRQAVIAVGSGGVLGRGLGQGLQSHLRFLPERQTDFIFASSAEEIGFLGMGLILALYVLLFWRIIRIMQIARDDLGMFIAAGVLFAFFFQVLINMGMNMAIMPVTGIPLPFLTYGGSSLLVSMIFLGIVQNVALQGKALRF